MPLVSILETLIMEQFQVPPYMEVIELDYKNQTHPRSIELFHPVVFRDGNTYCVLLGPNRETGVFGSGKTQEEAVIDWELQLREKINAEESDDEVGSYIQEVIAAEKLKGEPFA